MSVRFEGSEIQTNSDVRDLLDKIRRDPRTDNPRVLAIHQQAQITAKNGGYPLWMHHKELDAVQVRNEKEEDAMAQAGFQRQYIALAFPKFMHRRNLHPRFEKSDNEKGRLQTLTVEARNIEVRVRNDDDYIESRIVKDEAEEKKLLAEKPMKGVTSPWVDSVTKIEPWDEGPDEDHAVTIARMEGELNALRDKKAGRPVKDQPA